ncbi:MAG: DNA-3-methyladenine glycosylase 2 family protein [Hyphomicrobiales bacterium]|nr:DNA-3-methyladenine glycosylase 2 family protein [Hyphomicrobiales bacterium]
MHRRPARARGAKRVVVPTRVYHPGPPIADEASLRQAAEALRERDPELIDRLMAIGGPPPLRRREPGFAGLAAIIVSQQVSVASAKAIFGRLEARIVPLEAARFAIATEDDLRACGLSTPKIRALRALSEAVAEGGLDLAGLAALDAENAHAALVAVKGVGPWTADIFLLFCLGHPDAFPAGDLALQEAAKLALKLKTRPDAARLERIAERWRPWRGVAARMLWAYYRGLKERSGMVLAEASGSGRSRDLRPGAPR